MSLIKPGNYELLTRMLDLSAARQKAIANNIANVNTPGYQRMDVDFDKELKSVLTSGDKKAIEKLNLKTTRPEGTSFRRDGNNVDIDIEMAHLSENAITFNIYATLLRRKFQGLNELIKAK